MCGEKFLEIYAMKLKKNDYILRKFKHPIFIWNGSRIYSQEGRMVYDRAEYAVREIVYAGVVPLTPSAWWDMIDDIQKDLKDEPADTGWV